MGKINFTTSDINKTIALRNTPPTLDMVDGLYTTSSPLAVDADTEYRLDFIEANLVRNFKNGFNSITGITSMYNFTTKTTDWSQFGDTPMFVLLPNCLFKPTSANTGECIIRLYVNETSPILLDQAIVGFKGANYEKMGDLFSVYAGEEVGFDVKNKGLYATVEFSLAGSLANRAQLQYLT